MIQLGDYNTLQVVKFAERDNPHAYGGKETFGIYLDGGKEGDILMPQKYVPDGVKVGDFAFLECKWVNEYGAFLDWGLMKDLFCPFREQKRKMEIGDSYIVYIHVDEESYRIVATAKVDKYLDAPAPEALREGQQVEVLIWQKTDLGFKVIVDNRYQGLVYRDQIFRHVQTGDRMLGYVEKVRPDGKLDITLQPTGRRQTTDFAATLLQWIKEHGGHCPFGDKSAPDDIKRTFQVSKKVFKKAIGDLYKRRLITISDDGIELAG